MGRPDQDRSAFKRLQGGFDEISCGCCDWFGFHVRLRRRDGSIESRTMRRLCSGAGNARPTTTGAARGAARGAAGAAIFGGDAGTRCCRRCSHWRYTAGSPTQPRLSILLRRMHAAMIRHVCQAVARSARPGRQGLRGFVRPDHGADQHQHAERRHRGPRRDRHHDHGCAWLQPGLGHHRRRALSAGLPRRARAKSSDAARGAADGKPGRGETPDGGRIAGAAGVGVVAERSGFVAAKAASAPRAAAAPA